MYSNGVFVGEHKEYPVIRGSSTTKSKDMEEVKDVAITYTTNKSHLVKMSGVMKKKKDKIDTNFIPYFLDESEFGKERKAGATDNNRQPQKTQKEMYR